MDWNTQGVLHMELRSLAEAAAVISWYGSDTGQRLTDATSEPLWEFWKLSRYLQRSSLRQLSEGISSSRELTKLTEEVLVSELLTRVVAAQILNDGEISGTPELERLARQLIDGQRSVRFKAFESFRRRSDWISESLRVEKLLRRIERWSDLLISRLLIDGVSAGLEASFDPERCLDFREEWKHRDSHLNPDISLQFHLVALKTAIPNVIICDHARAEAHRQFAQAALLLFAPVQRSQLNPSAVRIHRLLLDDTTW